MFFEVLNHVDSALSVAVSLLALWQLLVGWALNGWFDPRAILVFILMDNSGDKNSIKPCVPRLRALFAL